MSIQERAKVIGENFEGKAQEAVGETTCDPEDRVEGKAKELDSQTRHAAEELKEEIDHRLD
ncbi:CsbD family protein [Microcoleus sp. FACHB-672]|uniref:CsbD family protein n=1 Tax=Microcoleus sp. FACHB-672 TaxID=2692825 RepID=UPI0016893084|nr:CsbD family protein [Microcoleus sp. FACHB-672]MBD2043063.1 CsbD family protein [Microcoleus sp. FACHB-672]